jgi:uroporphyrinogen-III synthase
MMNKRANLAAALQTATQGGEVATSASTVTALRTSTPSRVGKKTVAAHFDPAVSKQLKQLGLDRDTSTQALLREALNDLFTKYGKPPIA